MYKPIHRFRYCSQVVIPLTYSNALSYLEDIDKIAFKLNESIDAYNELIKYYNSLQGLLEEMQSTLVELDSKVDDMQAKIDTEIAELNSMFDRLQNAQQAQIDKLISDTNTQISQLESDLQATINQQIVIINTQLTQMRQEIRDNNAYIIGYVQSELNNFEQMIPELQNVRAINPYTGQLLPLDTVLYQMLDYICYHSLTAVEYDRLNLTAKEYDTFYVFGQTAALKTQQYDFWGRKYLWKNPREYMRNPETGSRVYYKGRINQNTDYIRECGALTAEEFDSCTRTAQELDMLNITAYNRDWLSNRYVPREEK